MNVRIVEFLMAGVGLRKTARTIGMSLRGLELKWRKIAMHGRRLDLNLKARAARANARGPRSDTLRIQFDELETYETRRNTRPLSVATMVEVRTRLIISAIAAPIRPRGTMTKQRLAAIAREDARFGRRRDRSRLACRSVFRSAAKLQPGATAVRLETDDKRTYPGYFREAFANTRRSHHTTSSKAPRGVGTPLFPINLTEAVMRDHAGRVRRDSWLVSKRRTHLNQHLAFYAAWKNWVLTRFNRDDHAPGVLAGMAPRNLSVTELLSWRQAWGGRSPCPYGNGNTVMADPLECPRAAELRAA